MNWRIKRRFILFVTIVLALGLIYHSGGAVERYGQLYHSVNGSTMAFDSSKAFMDARLVEIDKSVLAEEPDLLELQLPDGSPVRALVTGMEIRTADDMVWRGRLELGGGRVIFTQKDGVVIGNIETADGLYGLNTLPDGDQVLVRYNQSQFPDCAGELEPESRGVSRLPMYAPETGDLPGQIDVMIVYTPEARSAAGGTSQIEASIQFAVDQANTAFSDSNVFTRFNLVHSTEVSYNDSGNIYTDLFWLEADPTVAALRNTHSADLVSLIVENGGGFCGLGYVMRDPDPSFEAFSFQVTASFCIPNYTWAHESGHNMGMEHDPANGVPPSQASYPWSFGHFVSGEFRTVMSYSNQCSPFCPRVGRFSNPAISFNGHPTGISNERDNHRTANLTDDIVANFRESSPPPVQGLLYTPVPPCKIVDTRNTPGGIIGASEQRNFSVYGLGGTIGAQGGDPAGCLSPLGEPLAAHINMSAVDPTGKGNLQAFPLGAGPGAGLSVSYNTIDTNLTNAGTIQTSTGSGADITVTSRFASTHTVISVLGYYYPDGNLLYTPVPPCKIVDTRNTPGGIIGASGQRNFSVYGLGGTIGAQGGDPAGCLSPLGEPLAAHINMSAVDPTGKGNLQAFPLGAGPGAGLSVSYNTIDTNLTNAGTIQTSGAAGPDITVASRFASAHTVISVLGYYYANGNLLYTPVPPCKIVDTRNTPGGIIGASGQRNFSVYGLGGTIDAQGGDPAGCPSPLGEPLAAHINMSAVDPTGKGNLQAFPVGAGPGAGLSVSYNTIDTNLTNAGIIQTSGAAGPDITVASRFASTHTVISVLGYYYTAP